MSVLGRPTWAIFEVDLQQRVTALIISITNILHMLTSFFNFFHQGRFVFVSKNLFLVANIFPVGCKFF